MAEMIRAARPEDVAAIHAMIRELAEYEQSLAEAELSEDDLRQALFGPRPCVFAHVAELAGAPVGFALWFVNFSTWAGHGIYLEDLYVTPAGRRHGFGRALLAELAGICAERGYSRLQWALLDWNTPALDFYASLGAQSLDGWRMRRLSGPALQALAEPRAGR